MPPLGKAPGLISEHGAGQIVVKQHTRAAPAKRTPTPKKNPGRTPPVATGVPPAKAAAVVNPVDAQVTAAQLPANQQIDTAAAASKTAAENAATTTQGYYAALANLLKGIGPATQAGYASAGAADSAFGKGFSDGLAHVQSQNQDAATTAAGISGGAAPPPPSPAASDALYTLGGYIPATTMEREGAAFGAAANQLPATAAGQGAATIEGIGAQQRLDAAGFDKQRADLAAQVPGLRSQYQSQYDAQQNALATHNLAVANAKTHESDVRRQQQISMILATGVGPNGQLTPKAQAELANAMGYDPITGKPTARTIDAQGRLTIAKVNAQTAMSRLTLAQQKAISDLYGVGPDGKVTLAGRRVALAEWKAAHPAAKGGYTAAQKSKLQDSAAKLADLYYYGTPDKKNAQNVVTTPGVPAIADYQQALKLELSHGVPLAYALKALNALYPIGKEGRPWVDVRGRLILQTSGFPMTNPQAQPTRTQAAWLNQHGYPYNGPVRPDDQATPWPPPTK